MKYIAVGDLHIEENLPYSFYPGQRLKDEIEMAWYSMLYYAKSQDITRLLIAGDIFNNISVSPMEFRSFTNMMRSAYNAGIKHVMLVSGNHELDGNGDSIVCALSDMPRNEAWPEIHGPTLGSSIAVCAYDKHTIDMISFCETNENFAVDLSLLIDHRHPFHEKERTKYLLMAHQPVKGGKLKAIRSAKGLPEEWFSPTGLIGKHYDLCIFGDFHRAQFLPYRKGSYTGSIVQQDFRDEGSIPSFLEVDAKTMSTKKVKLDVPRFHTVKITEEASKPKISYTTKLRKGGYIKIEVTGTREFANKVQKKGIVETHEEMFKKDYKPIQIFTPPPIIVDRVIKTKTVRRSVSDEELVQQAVEGNDLTVSDKKLYEMGLEFISKARRKTKEK